jgi:16S rRNA (uracil1498-N3)-methyltransferase
LYSFFFHSKTDFTLMGPNSMRHFYIDPTGAIQSLINIEGSEAHHIKNVLRLKPGDPLKLFDGTGSEYEAVIRNFDGETVKVEIQRKLRIPVISGVRILVAQAFLKEKKMDDLVRQLTELGIAGWIPFFSQRSIARPEKKRLAGRIQRWNRIATEALKQCRRKNMPEISKSLSFDEMLKYSEKCDLKIVFWENETAPVTREFGSKTDHPLKSIMIMLGPEGGFTEQEIERARQAGFVTAGLGPRVLRAETATLTACALIQYLFGDMGSSIG